MAYREIGGARNYRAWKNWNEEDYIEGIYIEEGTTMGKYGEQAWYDLEVINANFTVEKENVALRLNGCGSLNKKMEKVPLKSKIKVIYYGKAETKDGEEFHDIKVLVADEDTVSKATADMDLSEL